MDDVEYIDPETIGGVNLYAYCNNNPVMGVDPNGTFGILLTLLISTGVGLALGTGGEIVKQAYNGGKWNWDASTWNWNEIGKAALLGAATGLATGLGGVAGGIVKGSFAALKIAGQTLSVAQSVGTLLGTMALTNFVAGAGAYAIGAGTQGESFNPFKMVLEGLGQIGSGLLSFFTSGMQVGFNIWKVGNGAKNSLSSIVGRSIGKLASNFIPKYVLENLF